MTFKLKLYSVALAGLVAAILVSLTGLMGIQHILSANERQDVLAEALANHSDGDMMHDAIRADILRILLALKNNDKSDLDATKDEMEEHVKRFRENLQKNTKLPLDAKTKSMLKNIQPSLESYISAAENLFVLAQTEPDKVHQKLPDFFATFSTLEKSMGDMSEELQAIIAEESKQAVSVNNSAKTNIAVMIVIFGIALALFSRWIINGVSAQLGTEPENAQAIAQRIARGDLEFTINASGNNHSLLGAMAGMLESLQDGAKSAKENMRLRQALDATSSNVMIADVNRNIVYMNKSVEVMLRNVESEMRKVLPQFTVDKIIGSNMDIFHKNPAHQSQLLASLNSPYVGNIVVSGLSFRLTASPIFDSDGSRLGSVVEWLDRTQEVAIEKEVSELVSATAAGNFKSRVSLDGKQGFFLNLAQGLNNLAETADRGLADVARVLGAIAKGDLTAKIDADYSGTFADLKNYCNETTESLSSIVGEIRMAADTIFTASSEIAQGNSDLSSRTEQQAASLEETASSMEELTSTVKLNADNAKQANVLADQAVTVASDGGALIQEVVTTMNDINESAEKIADIIGVIDGIAFQTNILALNAAVEAARAGDQGRGFAVVASEVRALAQRSANAAKDIKGLISDSVKKIESGNALVGRSGNTMKDIVTAIKRVNDIMAEIAAASHEQSSGISQVSVSVSQMDEMTQQNAALVEQAAAAAESLQYQADQLSQRVAQFSLANDATRSIQPSNARLSAPVERSAPAKAATKRLLPPKQQDDEWESF